MNAQSCVRRAKAAFLSVSHPETTVILTSGQDVIIDRGQLICRTRSANREAIMVLREMDFVAKKRKSSADQIQLSVIR